MLAVFTALTSCSSVHKNNPLEKYDEPQSNYVIKELLEYKKTQRNKINRFPGNITDRAWVKNKLQCLVNIDQKGRSLWSQYMKKNPANIYFKKNAHKTLFADKEHTAELKEMLNNYYWFTISRFGKQADHDGWLLIQHQDHDREFQKTILRRLTKLYKTGETSKINYAYLYDRVTALENNPQKYGTQGHCVDTGKWEPFTLENKKLVDKHRKSIGLEPLSKYKKRFKDICTHKD